MSKIKSEEMCGRKKMKSVPFFQWVLKTIFGEYDFPV